MEAVKACALSCSIPVRVSAVSRHRSANQTELCTGAHNASWRQLPGKRPLMLQSKPQHFLATFSIDRCPRKYVSKKEGNSPKGIRAMADKQPDLPEVSDSEKDTKVGKDAAFRKSRINMGCPCCGRRAALLGGSLGLVLPKEGLAQELPYAPVSSPKGPLRQWYEEFFAFALSKMGAVYEPKIQPFKDAVFHQLQSDLTQERRLESTLEVVEIGVGPAPNLHYWAAWPGSVHVTGVDYNSSMEPYAWENARQPGLDRLAFDFALGSATDLPFPSGSVDAVVSTLVLCSVKDVPRALAEVKRVLRPGGKFLFIEHVAAPDGTILRRFQNGLNPLQQALADGCNLNRDTLQAVRNAPFSSVDASSVNIDGLSLLAPHVVGIATA